VLLSRFCLKFVLTDVRSRWQKHLLPCLRATFVLAFLYQNASAKAESVHLCKNIEALAPLFLRALREFQEGTSWRVSWALLGALQEVP
jgi:hypothetical protein